MEYFAIMLGNPTTTFLPGQVITGNVIFRSRDEETSKGIVLRFKGEASVHWTETQRSNSMYNTTTGHGRSTIQPNGPGTVQTVSYNNSEVFFEYSIFLLGDGENEISLPPGETWYPFSIQLPMSNLYSSFKGDYGKVEYILKATAKRSFWKLDFKTYQVIPVNAIVDLNCIPMAGQPGEWRTIKTFCCLCCATGPLSMQISLNKRGHCPGDVLSVEVDVNNQSSKEIHDLSIQLLQEFTFFAAGGKTKHTSNLVMRVNRNQSVEPYGSAVWRLEFQIPILPPTNLGGCRIINLDYALKVKAHVSGAALSLKEHCPIFIGTVPFHQAGECNGEANFNAANIPSAPPLQAFLT